ncbi:MAG: hypothetical protein J7K72_00140, partial [Candidatus Aenigmarchaeota archaeon]|nr:hypothetical protein [Candidatus Aenigmarchaeota archaeon]
MGRKKEISGEGKIFGIGGQFSRSEEFESADLIREGLEVAFRLNKNKLGSSMPDDCAKILTALKRVDDLTPSETTNQIRRILQEAAKGCIADKESSCIFIRYTSFCGFLQY